MQLGKVLAAHICLPHCSILPKPIPNEWWENQACYSHHVDEIFAVDTDFLQILPPCSQVAPGLYWDV